MRLKRELVGQRFGKLVVLQRDGVVTGRKFWTARCDCGIIKSVKEVSLIRGDRVSCGCRQLTSRQLAPGEAAKNRLYDQYRNGARARSLSFDLSKEAFMWLVASECVYCGSPPNSKMSTRIKNLNGDFIYSGLDRIDSALGYSFDNCVPCCKICNKMKLDYSTLEFFEHIKKIAVHSKLR